MEQDTKIKILVVEDDISLKDSLVRLLQNRDFLVQAVENKQQAVEQIKSGQQYDIYLLDVWLPDGNGFDICHEIRKISQAIDRRCLSDWSSDVCSSDLMKSGKFHRRL